MLAPNTKATERTDRSARRRRSRISSVSGRSRTRFGEVSIQYVSARCRTWRSRMSFDPVIFVTL